MSIFENLEELNVSKKCFNDIINLIEPLLNETSLEARQSLISGRTNQAADANREAKVAKAAYRIAQSNAHSDLKDSGKGFELKDNMEQSARKNRAARAKLERAKTLVDKLNQRVQTSNGFENK